MGESTNAILGYGVALDEEVDDDIFDLIEEEEVERRFAKLGVKVSTHCHHEAPMLYIAVASTLTIAYRGYPMQIEWKESDTEIWDKNIREAYKILGELIGENDLDFAEECPKPGWFLCSDWN